MPEHPRHAYSFLLVLALSLIGFPGCSGADDGAEAPAGPRAEEIVLTVWTYGGTGQENAIAQWEAANPGVVVEEIVAGFDEHHERLRVAIAAGDVPDVALVEVGYSSLFKANPDNFVDLGATYGAERLEERFLPFRWEHGVAADDTIIGLPTDVGGLAVAYRTDLFEAAGLPTDPDAVSARMTTWADFLDLGTQYRDGSGGEPFIDSAALLFESALKQGSQGFYDTDRQLVHGESQHVAEAWTIAVEAIERDLSANLTGFSPEWNTGMANGSYAVQLAPSWMLTYISTQAPDTEGSWDIARIPGGGGNWGGSQMTIPAGARNQDLAYDLIEFLTAPERQIEIFQEFGNFPSTPEIYDQPAIADFTRAFFSDAPVGAIYIDSIDALEPQFEGRDQRAVLRQFNLGLGRIENEEETAEEAWDSVLENIALETG